MVISEKNFKTKFDPNMHENALNCTSLKINFRRACLRTPLAKRMISRHANFQI